MPEIRIKILFLTLILLVFFGSCKSENLQQNFLKHEKSPYLLQHKDNPVWWNAWNEKAINRAKKENKMIFLSIGYSTCHWCHVMEKESFENAEVAKFLNDNFVSIKVDREERADIDKIYMDILHMMGQRGGWPLTMFLTPDLLPIFGGTYFPKDNFMKLLRELKKNWKEKPEEILKYGNKVFEHLQNTSVYGNTAVFDSNIVLLELFENLSAQFDKKYGGFKKAPKFPPATTLRVLLRIAKRSADKFTRTESLKMVKETLDHMFRGGIYDHIGGGFHRYSTDEKWLVPHFEKMLYDNAILATTYFEADQIIESKIYKKVGVSILNYVLKEMSNPSGGYFSAEDADSEGEEGLYYLWSYDELEKALNSSEFNLFKKYFKISKVGNFEGKNLLNLIDMKNASETLTPKFQKIKQKLFAIRDKKIHPHKDDKILTAWNGLMITAMAKGYQSTKNLAYLESAQRAASFIQKELYKDKKLLRRYRDGEAKYNAYRDDYAYLIEGLIELYQSDFNTKWLTFAEELQASQNEKLWSEKAKAYFFSLPGVDLLKQPLTFHDSARPNSNGTSLLNLYRLYLLTYKIDYRRRADVLLAGYSLYFKEYPAACAQGLLALDLMSSKPKEVAIFSKNGESKFLDFLRKDLNYNHVVAVKNLEDQKYPQILEDKVSIESKETAYVCYEKVCLEPTNDFSKFKMQISELKKIEYPKDDSE